MCFPLVLCSESLSSSLDAESPYFLLRLTCGPKGSSLGSLLDSMLTRCTAFFHMLPSFP